MVNTFSTTNHSKWKNPKVNTSSSQPTIYNFMPKWSIGLTLKTLINNLPHHKWKSILKTAYLWLANSIQCAGRASSPKSCSTTTVYFKCQTVNRMTESICIFYLSINHLKSRNQNKHGNQVQFPANCKNLLTIQ